jgi:uncharacterized protein
MSKTFVKDPREVVKSGDVVRVKVLDVDVPRKRISLTLRLDDEAEGAGRTSRAAGGGRSEGGGADRGTPRGGDRGGAQRGGDRGGAQRGGQPRQARGGSGGNTGGGAMADALRRAGLDKGIGGR